MVSVVNYEYVKNYWINVFALNQYCDDGRKEEGALPSPCIPMRFLIPWKFAPHNQIMVLSPPLFTISKPSLLHLTMPLYPPFPPVLMGTPLMFESDVLHIHMFLLEHFSIDSIVCFVLYSVDVVPNVFCDVSYTWIYYTSN